MKINIIKNNYSINPFRNKKITNVNDVIKKEDYKNTMTENIKKIDERNY